MWIAPCYQVAAYLFVGFSSDLLDLFLNPVPQLFGLAFRLLPRAASRLLLIRPIVVPGIQFVVTHVISPIANIENTPPRKRMPVDQKFPRRHFRPSYRP
jgi:hypothetical protein